VARAAEILGLSHHLLRWSPPAAVSQAKARAARYALLAGCARQVGATHLATAHTLDDQAETILMRAAAGSGLAGLAGMRRVTRRGGVIHVRPFLCVPKARLVATCRANGWSYVDDPSNRDPAYERSRWRRLMPLLGEEGLTADRLSRLADRLHRADEALDRTAERAFGLIRSPGAGVVTLSGAALAREPDEIALRVLGLALAAAPTGKTGFPRLKRLETCLCAILTALGEGRAERRTLAGRQIVLDRAGLLTIRPELPRRRGTRAVTEFAAATPHSLGIDDARA
jgi:tRNA(Ile)-lysidine synthase